MAKAVGLSRNIKMQWLNINNEQIVNFMMMVAMKVDGNSYYTYTDLANMGILFPFSYQLQKEQLMSDERFVINNFGGELTVALK